MPESLEQQVAKVVDAAIERGDRSLPTWAAARLTRLLRELDADDRSGVVERVCGRPNLPAGLITDIRTSAEKASAAPQTRGVVQSTSPGARTFIGRSLRNVPPGTRVEYQGRHGVIEPPGLVLDDGRAFEFPTPAAMYVNDGIEINGWDAWKVADGRSLGECYEGSNWPPGS